MKRLIGLRSR